MSLFITNLYYINIYVCVCVCVCVRERERERDRETERVFDTNFVHFFFDIMLFV